MLLCAHPRLSREAAAALNPGHRLPAARAELLARLGRMAEARTAYDAALALCGNAAEADHLRRRRDAADPLRP